MKYFISICMLLVQLSLFVPFVNGHCESAIDNVAYEPSYTYDALGRLESIQMPSILEEEDHPCGPAFLSYHDEGRLVEITGANGTITSIRYTSNGQPQNIHYPDGSIESFQYANDGTLEKKEKKDCFGIQSIVTLDPQQRPVHAVKINAMGKKSVEAFFGYDDSGNRIFERHLVLVEGIVQCEYVIRRHFDAANRLLWIAEGEEERSKMTRYSYHENGQLEQITKPDGITINYTYDEKGLLQKVTASNGSFGYAFDYDQFQHVAAIRDLCRNTVQSRSYNEAGQLLEEYQCSDVKIKYHYDQEGRYAGITLPDGSQVIYHYEGKNLSSIDRTRADQTIHYSHTCKHNEQGLLTSCGQLNGFGEVKFQYDHQKRLSGISSPWWSQKIPSSGFDSNGRILEMTVKDARGEISSFFSYTDEGQLAEEAGHRYVYDSLYNRIGVDDRAWEVNSLNQLIKTHDNSYVYDRNGNVVEKLSSDGSIFYTYDAMDRMIRMECPGKIAITYVYDAFHRRLERQSWKWSQDRSSWSLEATEKYLYDGFKDIGKMDGQGKIVEFRVLGDGHRAEMGAALSLELQGRVFVPIHDIQGSVRCLVDADTGKVVESYNFSAYGEESLCDENGSPVDQSQVGNPWRFCSKRIDDATNLVFFGKRDYDPKTSRWMTPDPLYFCDTSNLYAFARNDPLNCCDLYGLFSITTIWDNFFRTLFSSFQYFQTSAHKAKMGLGAELKFPPLLNEALEKIGKALFGESTYLLMGPHFEETEIDCYGEREISDKVRVTFINGILNTRTLLKDTLEMVSSSHGGVKIHYVFRPTEGWTWDISRAIMIKTAFLLGFRSLHAHLLAELWRNLIQEMGGVEGGGTVVHYAHSLGGSETDRARKLLSPDEQKMIRVITFGSSTFVRNEGFQYVINNVSVNDGVSSFILEPLGHIRNFFDPDTNVRYHGTYFRSPSWPTDHLLNGPTYGPLLRELGNHFVEEFAVRN